jgi:hypothetical protein
MIMPETYLRSWDRLDGRNEEKEQHRQPRRSTIQSKSPNRRRNSAPNTVWVELDVRALSDMIAGRSEILPFLPNAKDHLVVSRLSTAPIGDLSVDRFAELFCKKGKLPSDRDVTNLRLALIQIYLRAATSRMSARASRSQIMSARNASNRLRDAIRLLEDISPARQRGLQGAFGSPFDDPKGLDEHNEFSSASMQIKRDMIPIAMRLDRAIENETGKPFVRGERKKRLRILAEALANWWIATTVSAVSTHETDWVG